MEIYTDTLWQLIAGILLLKPNREELRTVEHFRETQLLILDDLYFLKTIIGSIGTSYIFKVPKIRTGKWSSRSTDIDGSVLWATNVRI